MNDAWIRLLFLWHAAATWYTSGLIWFVQVDDLSVSRDIGLRWPLPVLPK
jgi:hypothetical protein